MKKLILTLIMSLTLLLSSCSLFNYDDLLNQGYENLILEQEVVSYDFDKKHEKELYQKIRLEFENIVEIPSHFVPSDSVFREFIGKES